MYIWLDAGGDEEGYLEWLGGPEYLGSITPALLPVKQHWIIVWYTLNGRLKGGGSVEGSGGAEPSSREELGAGMGGVDGIGIPPTSGRSERKISEDGLAEFECCSSSATRRYSQVRRLRRQRSQGCVGNHSVVRH
ncbi:hypothetical protein FB451DRAFT_1164753 [Mycena latifolia]|nr:hypothetical protein FB451DRAFT_1164753 [Mycena latifolia]